MFDNLREIFALLLVYQRLENYISSRQFITWVQKWRLSRLTDLLELPPFSRANFSKVRYFRLNLILCRKSPVDGYSKSAEFILVHIFNFEENAFKVWENW